MSGQSRRKKAEEIITDQIKKNSPAANQRHPRPVLQNSLCAMDLNRAKEKWDDQRTFSHPTEGNNDAAQDLKTILVCDWPPCNFVTSVLAFCCVFYFWCACICVCNNFGRAGKIKHQDFEWFKLVATLDSAWPVDFYHRLLSPLPWGACNSSHSEN